MTIVNNKSTRKSPSQWLLVWRRINQTEYAMIALYFVAFNILIAVLYPLVIPYSPLSTDPIGDNYLGGGANRQPNLRYPAGTGPVGRDSFSFLLAGAETSLIVGFVATAISLSIGIVVGLTAGYYEGVVEEILMRITDMFLAIPFLIITMALVQVMFSSTDERIRNIPTVWIIIIVLGIFGWAGLARLVVAQTKQTKQLDFVKAARVLGASDYRIIVKHILPNIMAAIIVVLTLTIGGNILAEAGLTYLGVGSPSTTVSWGVQVSFGQNRLKLNPEQALVPGFAIFFLVLSTNLFGDALRDASDPRLKQ